MNENVRRDRRRVQTSTILDVTLGEFRYFKNREVVLSASTLPPV
jgi:hypothetical protein